MIIYIILLIMEQINIFNDDKLIKYEYVLHTNCLY
jgi:hypothetical protein